MKEISLIVYLLLFILLFISTLLILLGISKRNKYLFKNRLKQINWRKFSKMSFTIFGILLLASLNNEMFRWYDSLLISIVISYMVVIHIFISIEPTKDESEYLSSKSFNRECKIDDILKKKIL